MIFTMALDLLKPKADGVDLRIEKLLVALSKVVVAVFTNLDKLENREGFPLVAFVVVIKAVKLPVKILRIVGLDLVRVVVVTSDTGVDIVADVFSETEGVELGVLVLIPDKLLLPSLDVFKVTVGVWKLRDTKPV